MSKELTEEQIALLRRSNEANNLAHIDRDSEDWNRLVSVGYGVMQHNSEALFPMPKFVLHNHSYVSSGNWNGLKWSIALMRTDMSIRVNVDVGRTVITRALVLPRSQRDKSVSTDTTMDEAATLGYATLLGALRAFSRSAALDAYAMSIDV